MSIDEQRAYICGGKEEHLKLLEAAALKGGRYDWWPIKRSAHTGNTVIFYLKNPIAAFVAWGIVEDEVGPCPDQTGEFRDAPCAYIRDIQMLPRHVPRNEAREHFPEWKFLKMPQARAEVPGKWVKSFLQLLKVGTPPPPPPPPNDGSNMKALLEQFGQIILYGPPGTGKTREAKHLALALLTGKEVNAASTDDDIEDQLRPFKDADHFDLVVFHPAYEYEQFVGGIEPTLTGQQITFKANAGIFTRLCRKAKEDKVERPAVLIIDEINRGNLPKLLGELVYALEYRGHQVRLPFDDGQPNLIVPKNLYVIATMNSADRSIGHIDVAIRRRFGLYPLEPNSEVVREVWSRARDEPYGRKLAALMDRVNQKLGSGHDPNAGAEMGVGQSYFLPKPDASGEIAKEQVRMKWTYQVQPLLREYAQVLNLDANSLQAFSKPLDDCLGQS